MASAAEGDEKEYVDYYSELVEIEKVKEPEDFVEDDSLKTPEEGEQELNWLKIAGYAHLASKLEVGVTLDDDVVAKETHLLTKEQAAAVKKRTDTLNATIRKQQKQQKRGDVRELFDNHSPLPLMPSNQKSVPDFVLNQKDSKTSVKRQSSGKTFHKTSLLRNRGGYSLGTGNDSSSVFDDKGISMLRIHSTLPDLAVDCASRNGHHELVRTISSTSATKIVANHESVLRLTQQIELVQSNNRECDLPDLVIREDMLDMTYIDDLSKKDLNRVRPLALIELTSLYDTRGITYIHRKSNIKSRESGLFGVSLQTLLDHDNRKGASLRVPLFFQELIKYLETNCLDEEGILRVPGSVNRIKSLRHDLELMYKKGQLTFVDIQAHDAAGLLKLFLRELSIPLLTFEYLEAFAQLERISHLRTKLEALNFLFLLLPDVHRNTLMTLLEFLQKIVDDGVNKMTLNSVAMIMAPNLFMVNSRHNNRPKSYRDVEVSKAAEMFNIVRLMIKYRLMLIMVPSFLMSQMRRQYQMDCKRNKENKSIKRRFGTKNRQDPQKTTNNDHLQKFGPTANLIRVQAPQLSKFNTTIQLDSMLTAGDVIARFSSSSEPTTPLTKENSGSHNSISTLSDSSRQATAAPASPNISLYEIGGNIGERRLNHAANMLTVVQSNPNAEWIIKTNVEKPS